MSDITRTSDRSLYTAGRRRRKHRLWLWPLLAVVVIAVVIAVVFFVADSRTVALGAISPAPGSLLNAPTLTVSAELSRFQPGRGAVTFTVDGQPVPATDVVLKDGLAQARLTVSDGPHTVAFTYAGSGLFSHGVDRTWDFTIDTTAPQVSVKSPSSFPRLGARSSKLAFVLSEAGTATLTLDGEDIPVDSAKTATTASTDGSTAGAAAAAGAIIKVTLVAGEGPHVLVLRAIDKAGNSTTKQWDVMVDSQPPALTAGGLPDEDVWTKLNSASVALVVSDRFAADTQVTATLDGAPLTLQEQTSKAANKRTIDFETGTLPEGTHSLVITATDPGGHVATIKRDFLVDTSNVFGPRTMKSGAEGDDVKQLQRILKIKAVYDGDPTGVFDAPTGLAVAAFNTQHGIDGGEAVTAQTLKYLLGYIRIDLSERKLYLYGGDDKLIKSYGVAVGMPAYPTPVGSFRIITKAKNPTWNPPDSAWAAGMGPVPPGPDNPLGTRWMGLNSPGIGIHGTPAPSSIGTAASHGCIRMRIPEVEELFDRVFVGTPVEIVR